MKQGDPFRLEQFLHINDQFSRAFTHEADPKTCAEVGFGDCATNRTAPPLPISPPIIVGMGQTCGPIVNAKCGGGLCCSGSNYCGGCKKPLNPCSSHLNHYPEKKRQRKKHNQSPLISQDSHAEQHEKLTIDHDFTYKKNRNHGRFLWSGQLVPAALGQLQWPLTRLFLFPIPQQCLL